VQGDLQEKSLIAHMVLAAIAQSGADAKSES
jgi:hypothetical protein